MSLLDRVRNRDCTVGIIGLGYVGLPLAVELALGRFHVTGFDVDVGHAEERVVAPGGGEGAAATLRFAHEVRGLAIGLQAHQQAFAHNRP